MHESHRRGTFGPISAIEGNLIRLADPSEGQPPDQFMAFGQLAEQSATIADLMLQLMSELERLEPKHTPSNAVDRARLATERFVVNLGQTARALERFRPVDACGRQASSSEKKVE